MTDTWSRSRSAEKTTSSAFTFSLRRVNSASQLGVGDRHPVGERRAQLVDEQRLAQVVLELGLGERRVLRRQDLRVELLAAKDAVLLERGNREDPLRDLGVRDRQAQAPGLGHGGPLVNQLPQDLTGPRPAA